MATYGWTPREVDELTLRELVNAMMMLGMIRRDRIADMATAVRASRVDDDKKWTRFMRSLES